MASELNKCVVYYPEYANFMTEDEFRDAINQLEELTLTTPLQTAHLLYTYQFSLTVALENFFSGSYSESPPRSAPPPGTHTQQFRSSIQEARRLSMNPAAVDSANETSDDDFHAHSDDLGNESSEDQEQEEEEEEMDEAATIQSIPAGSARRSPRSPQVTTNPTDTSAILDALVAKIHQEELVRAQSRVVASPLRDSKAMSDIDQNQDEVGEVAETTILSGVAISRKGPSAKLLRASLSSFVEQPEFPFDPTNAINRARGELPIAQSEQGPVYQATGGNIVFPGYCVELNDVASKEVIGVTELESECLLSLPHAALQQGMLMLSPNNPSVQKAADGSGNGNDGRLAKKSKPNSAISATKIAAVGLFDQLMEANDENENDFGTFGENENFENSTKKKPDDFVQLGGSKTTTANSTAPSSFSSSLQFQTSLRLLKQINPALYYSDFTRSVQGHPYRDHWRYQLTKKNVPTRSYLRTLNLNLSPRDGTSGPLTLKASAVISIANLIGYKADSSRLVDFWLPFYRALFPSAPIHYKTFLVNLLSLLIPAYLASRGYSLPETLQQLQYQVQTRASDLKDPSLVKFEIPRQKSSRASLRESRASRADDFGTAIRAVRTLSRAPTLDATTTTTTSTSTTTTSTSTSTSMSDGDDQSKAAATAMTDQEQTNGLYGLMYALEHHSSTAHYNSDFFSDRQGIMGEYVDTELWGDDEADEMFYASVDEDYNNTQNNLIEVQNFANSFTNASSQTTLKSISAHHDPTTPVPITQTRAGYLSPHHSSAPGAGAGAGCNGNGSGMGRSGTMMMGQIGQNDQDDVFFSPIKPAHNNNNNNDDDDVFFSPFKSTTATTTNNMNNQDNDDDDDDLFSPDRPVEKPNNNKNNNNNVIKPIISARTNPFRDDDDDDLFSPIRPRPTTTTASTATTATTANTTATTKTSKTVPNDNNTNNTTSSPIPPPSIPSLPHRTLEQQLYSPALLRIIISEREVRNQLQAPSASHNESSRFSLGRYGSTGSMDSFFMGDDGDKIGGNSLQATDFESNLNISSSFILNQTQDGSQSVSARTRLINFYKQTLEADYFELMRPFSTLLSPQDFKDQLTSLTSRHTVDSTSQSTTQSATGITTTRFNNVGFRAGDQSEANNQNGTNTGQAASDQNADPNRFLTNTSLTVPATVADLWYIIQSKWDFLTQFFPAEIRTRVLERSMVGFHPDMAKPLSKALYRRLTATAYKTRTRIINVDTNNVSATWLRVTNPLFHYLFDSTNRAFNQPFDRYSVSSERSAYWTDPAEVRTMSRSAPFPPNAVPLSHNTGYYQNDDLPNQDLLYTANQPCICLPSRIATPPSANLTTVVFLQGAGTKIPLYSSAFGKLKINRETRLSPGTFICLTNIVPLIKVQEYLQLRAILNSLLLTGHSGHSPYVNAITELLKFGMREARVQTLYVVTHVEVKHHNGVLTAYGGTNDPPLIHMIPVDSPLTSTGTITSSIPRHSATGYKVVATVANLATHGAFVANIPTHQQFVSLDYNRPAVRTPHLDPIGPALNPDFMAVSDKEANYNAVGANVHNYGFVQNAKPELANLGLLAWNEHQAKNSKNSKKFKKSKTKKLLHTSLVSPLHILPPHLHHLYDGSFPLPATITNPFLPSQHATDELSNTTTPLLFFNTNLFSTKRDKIIISNYLLPTDYGTHTFSSPSANQPESNVVNSGNVITDTMQMFQNIDAPADGSGSPNAHGLLPFLPIPQPRMHFGSEHLPLHSAPSVPPPLHSPHGTFMWYLYAPSVQQTIERLIRETVFPTFTPQDHKILAQLAIHGPSAEHRLQTTTMPTADPSIKEMIIKMPTSDYSVPVLQAIVKYAFNKHFMRYQHRSDGSSKTFDDLTPADLQAVLKVGNMGTNVAPNQPFVDWIPDQLGRNTTTIYPDSKGKKVTPKASQNHDDGTLPDINDINPAQITEPVRVATDPGGIVGQYITINNIISHRIILNSWEEMTAWIGAKLNTGSYQQNLFDTLLVGPGSKDMCNLTPDNTQIVSFDEQLKNQLASDKNGKNNSNLSKKGSNSSISSISSLASKSTTTTTTTTTTSSSSHSTALVQSDSSTIAYGQGASLRDNYLNLSQSSSANDLLHFYVLPQSPLIASIRPTEIVKPAVVSATKRRFMQRNEEEDEDGFGSGKQNNAQNGQFSDRVQTNRVPLMLHKPIHISNVLSEPRLTSSLPTSHVNRPQVPTSDLSKHIKVPLLSVLDLQTKLKESGRGVKDAVNKSLSTALSRSKNKSFDTDFQQLVKANLGYQDNLKTAMDFLESNVINPSSRTGDPDSTTDVQTVPPGTFRPITGSRTADTSEELYRFVATIFVNPVIDPDRVFASILDLYAAFDTLSAVPGHCWMGSSQAPVGQARFFFETSRANELPLQIVSIASIYNVQEHTKTHIPWTFNGTTHQAYKSQAFLVQFSVRMPQCTPARSSPGLEDSATALILKHPLLLLSNLQEQFYLYKKLYNQALAIAPPSIVSANPAPFDLEEESKLFELAQLRPDIIERRAGSLQFMIVFKSYPSNLQILQNCLKRLQVVIDVLTTNKMDVAMPLEAIIINNYTLNYQSLSLQIAVFQLSPTPLSTELLSLNPDAISPPQTDLNDSFLLDNARPETKIIEIETQHAARSHPGAPSSQLSAFKGANHVVLAQAPLKLPPNIFSIMQLYTPILRSHPLFTPTLNTQWSSKSFQSRNFTQFIAGVIGNAQHHPHNQRLFQKIMLLNNLSSLPPDPLRLSIRTTFNPQEDYLPPNVHELLYVNLHDYQQQTVNWALREERSTYNINRHVYEPIVTGSGRLLWVSIPHLIVRTHLPVARRGGICAEDMGAGKTLISIALIAGNPRPLRSPYSWQEEHEKQWDGGHVIISANLLMRQILLTSQTQSVYDNPANTMQENVYSLIQHHRDVQASRSRNQDDGDEVELAPHLQAFDPLGTQLKYYTQPHVKMCLAMVSDAKNILKIIKNDAIGSKNSLSKYSYDIETGTGSVQTGEDIDRVGRIYQQEETTKKPTKAAAAKKTAAATVPTTRKTRATRGNVLEIASASPTASAGLLRRGGKGRAIELSDDEDVGLSRNGSLQESEQIVGSDSSDNETLSKARRGGRLAAKKTSVLAAGYEEFNVIENTDESSASEVSASEESDFEEEKPRGRKGAAKAAPKGRGKKAAAEPVAPKPKPVARAALQHTTAAQQMKQSIGTTEEQLEILAALTEKKPAKKGKKSKDGDDDDGENDGLNEEERREGEASASMNRALAARNVFRHISTQFSASNLVDSISALRPAPASLLKPLRFPEAFVDTKAATSSNARKKPAAVAAVPDYSQGSIWSGATLIVAVSTTIGQWIRELHTYAPSLSICLLYDGNRERDPLKIASYDVVITSYQVAAIESKSTGSISAIDWWRIVYDEGHCLRDTNTMRNKTLTKVTTANSWLLTGTPYNTAPSTDMKGLLEILSVEQPPTDSGRNNYFFRSVLSNMTIRHLKSQPFNGRSALISLPTRNYIIHRVMMTPEEQYEYARIYTRAFKRFKTICESNHASHFAFILTGMMNGVRRACAIGNPEISSSFSNTFFSQDLSHLIQRVQAAAAALPAGAKIDLEKLAEAVSDAYQDITAMGEECTVCLCEFTDPVQTKCGHVYCRECIEGILENGSSWTQPSCPICRAAIKKNELTVPRAVRQQQEELAKKEKEEAALLAKNNDGGDDSSDADDDNGSNSASNELPFDPNNINYNFRDDPFSAVSRFSKLKQLMSIITTSISRSEKTVVFSQYGHSLELIHSVLVAAGIGVRQVNGAMSSLQRDRMVNEFNDNPDVSVFLLSVRVGSVGLTLTAANSLILLEPCVNVSHQVQAENRVFRLGQTKDVTIHYLLSVLPKKNDQGTIIPNEYVPTIEETQYNLNESRRSRDLGSEPQGAAAAASQQQERALSMDNWNSFFTSDPARFVIAMPEALE